VAAVLLATVGACGADDTAPVGDAVLGVVVRGCASPVEGRATGVVVDTYAAVTVAHAFLGVDDVELVDRHGRVWGADVALIDPSVDLAVLRLRDPHPSPLELADFEVGSPGRTISFADPAGQRVDEIEVRRRVTAVLDGEDPRLALELGAELGRGDSGAPVLDAADRVGGIVFAASRRAARGWAVDVSEVRTVLRRAEAGAEPVALRCP
jgi:S1-C subfamily serine protease